MSTLGYAITAEGYSLHIATLGRQTSHFPARRGGLYKAIKLDGYAGGVFPTPPGLTTDGFAHRTGARLGLVCKRARQSAQKAEPFRSTHSTAWEEAITH